MGWKSNKIKIGKLKKKNISIVLFDMSFINKTLDDNGSKAVNGIIGADILKKSKAILDYKSNKLYLKLWFYGFINFNYWFFH